MTDNTQSPLERAARALWIAEGGDPKLWDNPSGRSVLWVVEMDKNRPVYYSRAREVLQAIREPSNTMLNADDGEDERWDGVFVRNAWRKMIDAALEG